MLFIIDAKTNNAHSIAFLNSESSRRGIKASTKINDANPAANGFY